MDEPLEPIGNVVVLEEARIEAGAKRPKPTPEQLAELLREFPPADGPGYRKPPNSHVFFWTWMTERRRATGRVGGRKPKPKVSADTVLAAAGAAPNQPAQPPQPEDDELTLQRLARPHRAAAIAVLIAQMDADDEGIRQRAAFRILEITDGKPGTAMPEQTGPTEVMYETRALEGDEPDPPAQFVPGFGL